MRYSATHLEELAHAQGDSADLPFLVLGESTTTYAEAYAASRAVAHGLRHLGVLAGDRVVIVAPNRPEAAWVWFGVNAMGAIDAPISHELKGAHLDYFLRDLEPRVVVGTEECLRQLAESSSYRPESVVVLDAAAATSPLGPDVRHLSYDELTALGSGETDHLPPEADTTATIIYTSGTTGPSKGVMLSHGYWGQLARTHLSTVPFKSHEVVYCAQPLCHIDPRSLLVDCLFVRGTLVLSTRFSASTFWSEVERHDADKFIYVGTMLHLIHLQPDTESAREKRPRIGMGSAAPEALYRRIEERFAVTLYEGYGMTEVPLITHQVSDNAGPGHIGRAIPAIEVRLLDGSGDEVPLGEVGECVIRPASRFHMMQGYWRKPEATLEAMRGLWFHTGDNLRQLEDGSFVYIGRKKDAIRRRGENVSAWEVEEAAHRHPAVQEAAALGVPSPLGEEDVALLVVPVDPAAPLDLAALRDFMAADLPRFAVPRFIEVVDSLPKTPSQRIAKGAVRERGITADAFDAEASRSARRQS